MPCPDKGRGVGTPLPCVHHSANAGTLIGHHSPDARYSILETLRLSLRPSSLPPTFAPLHRPQAALHFCTTHPSMPLGRHAVPTLPTASPMPSGPRVI
jgi:hypothetical protein